MNKSLNPFVEVEYVKIMFICKRFDTYSEIRFYTEDYSNLKECKKAAYNKFKDLKATKKFHIYCAYCNNIKGKWLSKKTNKDFIFKENLKQTIGQMQLKNCIR